MSAKVSNRRSQVSPGFLLDAHGGHALGEVAVAYPGGGGLEGFLDRAAEAGFGQHPLEFSRRRFTQLLGDSLEALQKGKAGPQ